MDIQITQKTSAQELIQDRYEKYQHDKRQQFIESCAEPIILISCLAYLFIVPFALSKTVFKNAEDPVNKAIITAIAIPVALALSVAAIWAIYTFIRNTVRRYIQCKRIQAFCAEIAQLYNKSFSSLDDFQTEIKRIFKYEYFLAYSKSHPNGPWWASSSFSLARAEFYRGQFTEDYRLAQYMAKHLNSIYLPLFEQLLSQSSWASMSGTQQKAVKIKLNANIEHYMQDMFQYYLCLALGGTQTSLDALYRHVQNTDMMDRIEHWIQIATEY